MRRTAVVPVVVLASLLCLAVSEARSAPNAWRREIPKKLEETKISVHFEETPLREALGFLSQSAGISITLDPEVDPEKPEPGLLVTLSTDNLELGSALDLVTRLAGLAHDVRWGGVFVSTPDRLFELPRDVRFHFLDPQSEPTKKVLSALGKPVTFSFEETPTTDALNFLSEIATVNILVSPEVAEAVEKALLTASVHEMPSRYALCQILFPHGFTFRIRHGVIMVERMPEDPEGWWKEKAERILARTKVSLNFDSTPLRSVLEFLRQLVLVPVHLDPAVMDEKSAEELMVTLRADDISIKNALELTTLVKGLAWDFRWGGVFVSTPERLEALPRSPLPPAGPKCEGWERALRVSLRGGISFSFAATEVGEALGFLRNLKGINIVLDPGAREKAKTTTLTLAVNGVTVEHALSLMLLPRGLTYELRHEVLLVKLAN